MNGFVCYCLGSELLHSTWIWRHFWWAALVLSFSSLTRRFWHVCLWRHHELGTVFGAQLGFECGSSACFVDDRGEFDLFHWFHDRFLLDDDDHSCCVLGGKFGEPFFSAFAGAMLIGLLNGYIVVKTGLPSFLWVWRFLFILRGFDYCAVYSIH